MARKITRNIPCEMKKLGIYLKNLREDLGWSIRHAAKQINVSPGYLSKIEASDTFQSIGVAILVRLSEIYEIPISDILKEADFIQEDEDELPDFALYLKGKFRMSSQAIRDMKMAKEIVEKKYKKV